MTLPRLFAALALAAAASACAPSALVASGALLTRSVFQERATLDALTDTEIAFGVQHRLAKHSGELYRDVSVDVVEGEVVLTGSVPRRADRIAATKAAWDTPSVIAVSDALVVAEDGGTSAYISDVRLANQVRYGLITDTSVRSINYTVTV
ncbi:MAG: BON domain-containing protein, partial [Pseudomonadota bacterium]